MKHLKLFESFVSEAKADDQNVSLKKAKKRINRKLDEAATEEEKREELVKDELDKLFKQLVPPIGPAETIEGEMVRAMARVLFRYFNDGDYFFRGYGKQTVQHSVKWLRTESPVANQIKTAFSYAQRNALKANHEDEYNINKDGYLEGLIDAAEIVVDYVKSKKNQYTKNTADSR